MKNWQWIDIVGRSLILVAAFVQIFFVTPLTNFDLSVFWFNAVENQSELARLLVNDDLGYDEETRILAKIYDSVDSANQYSSFHEAIKKYSSHGFALLFLFGSSMLLAARSIEFRETNRDED
ncbi:MAG: hypothetical protein ABJH52_16135 [Henriciella sp.]